MKEANITVVTYNRLDLTKKCLESLQNNTMYPYKLTIIDNGSTDGTLEWLEDNQYNFISLGENLGIAKGYNLGWYLGPKDYYVN